VGRVEKARQDSVFAVAITCAAIPVE